MTIKFADDLILKMIEYVATICFALAILHTFSVKYFQTLAHKYREGSIGENLFHLLGEVEVVFGFWAGIFIVFFMALVGVKESLFYLESRNFTEPLFVFVIMTICATKPILSLGEKIIRFVGHLIPINKNLGFFFATLSVGPILGSFITEPAAMTVTALILLKNFYQKNISNELKYATLGLLFVNISIGGTLTPYAAPPVLMVAAKWNWDLKFMLLNFGWKAFIAILISTLLIAFRFRKEISNLNRLRSADTNHPLPIWVMALHLLFLVAVVICAHHIVAFMGIFLFFLGIATVTKEYHDELKIKESLLIGFFLAGLIVLGGQQSWWLEPILQKLSAFTLYLGAITLTAFTDNAAITYLGSQVPDLSEISKYALVAGSVVGGGLTVIANAPNPAGFSILNPTFGPNGIGAKSLLLGACLPTIVAGLCFWLL